MVTCFAPLSVFGGTERARTPRGGERRRRGPEGFFEDVCEEEAASLTCAGDMLVSIHDAEVPDEVHDFDFDEAPGGDAAWHGVALREGKLHVSSPGLGVAATLHGTPGEHLRATLSIAGAEVQLKGCSVAVVPERFPQAQPMLRLWLPDGDLAGRWAALLCRAAMFWGDAEEGQALESEVDFHKLREPKSKLVGLLEVRQKLMHHVAHMTGSSSTCTTPRRAPSPRSTSEVPPQKAFDRTPPWLQPRVYVHSSRHEASTVRSPRAISPRMTKAIRRIALQRDMLFISKPEKEDDGTAETLLHIGGAEVVLSGSEVHVLPQRSAPKALTILALESGCRRTASELAALLCEAAVSHDVDVLRNCGLEGQALGQAALPLALREFCESQSFARGCSSGGTPLPELQEQLLDGLMGRGPPGHMGASPFGLCTEWLSGEVRLVFCQGGLADIPAQESPPARAAMQVLSVSRSKLRVVHSRAGTPLIGSFGSLEEAAGMEDDEAADTASISLRHAELRLHGPAITVARKGVAHALAVTIWPCGDAVEVARWATALCLAAGAADRDPISIARPALRPPGGSSAVATPALTPAAEPADDGPDDDGGQRPPPALELTAKGEDLEPYSPCASPAKLVHDQTLAELQEARLLLEKHAQLSSPRSQPVEAPMLEDKGRNYRSPSMMDANVAAFWRDCDDNVCGASGQRSPFSVGGDSAAEDASRAPPLAISQAAGRALEAAAPAHFDISTPPPPLLHMQQQQPLAPPVRERRQQPETAAVLPPRRLRVISARCCGGSYELVPGLTPNGMPAWKMDNADYWVYSGSSSHWFVDGPLSRSEVAAERNRGRLRSKQTHRGSMPDALSLGCWLFYDGEAWYDDPEVGVISGGRDACADLLAFGIEATPPAAATCAHDDGFRCERLPTGEVLSICDLCGSVVAQDGKAPALQHSIMSPQQSHSRLSPMTIGMADRVAAACPSRILSEDCCLQPSVRAWHRPCMSQLLASRAEASVPSVRAEVERINHLVSGGEESPRSLSPRSDLCQETSRFSFAAVAADQGGDQEEADKAAALDEQPSRVFEPLSRVSEPVSQPCDAPATVAAQQLSPLLPANTAPLNDAALKGVDRPAPAKAFADEARQTAPAPVHSAACTSPTESAAPQRQGGAAKRDWSPRSSFAVRLARHRQQRLQALQGLQGLQAARRP
eukprot:TRINITY_DN18217_c0_g1_i1.p1 TRINITY_DN18217_c0_g1~~TRINITY_DN18217_c0_g1_i1.p1  ORF type:complete len:1187 (+),score=284.50 TRINITY_DN18217_c0_g1_i1:178-3738(+)